MSDSDRSIVQWSATEVVVIPSNSQPAQIVEFGRAQLSKRDMNSIVAALQNESYEMVATFVWAKASAVLKKQLASLGMEFVGEMLGRADLDEDSDPSTSIADHEALSLAEDLAIITRNAGSSPEAGITTCRTFHEFRALRCRGRDVVQGGGDNPAEDMCR